MPLETVNNYAAMKKVIDLRGALIHEIEHMTMVLKRWAIVRMPTTVQWIICDHAGTMVGEQGWVNSVEIAERLAADRDMVAIELDWGFRWRDRVVDRDKFDEHETSKILFYCCAPRKTFLASPATYTSDTEWCFIGWLTHKEWEDLGYYALGQPDLIGSKDIGRWLEYRKVRFLQEHEMRGVGAYFKKWMVQLDNGYMDIPLSGLTLAQEMGVDGPGSGHVKHTPVIGLSSVQIKMQKRERLVRAQAAYDSAIKKANRNSISARKGMRIKLDKRGRKIMDEKGNPIMVRHESILEDHLRDETYWKVRDDIVASAYDELIAAKEDI